MARHGENIHKRKDGRWEARVIIRYDENNKALYQSLYGSTYEEVKTKKEGLKKKSQPKNHSDMTFDQAAELWLNSKKDKIKTSSYNHYSNQYRFHIKPGFDGKKLSELKTEDYNQFLKNKEEDGYSSRTLLLLRTIIQMILRYAERNYQVPSVSGITMPKSSRKQAEAFSRKEQAVINQYLFDHLDHYTLAVLISMYCGLRIGEVCALQWKDLDLNNGTLTVSKTLLRLQDKESEDQTKTKVVVQKPKTESSSRKIPIPDFIKEVILRNFHDDPEYFVITGDSHHMEPRVCSRKFKKILAALDMENYTFHSCRHTFATRCVELGIDAKILSELLGHSSVKTTLDRYVHPSMDFKKEQVNKLAQLSDHK